MSQNHFTLSFPLKSPADAKALAEELPPLMPELFQAEDTIGTIHYSRFTVLSEKTLLFLGDFDGEFGQLMADLAKHAGPVFDAIFQHVDNPPPTPVADNADAFVEWTAEHLLHAVNLYTAYPDVTAKEIKALAAAADVTGAGEQLPFLVILPIKSHLAYIEVELLLRARAHGTPERPGHGRHTPFRPVRAAGGQPDRFLYRLRRLIRQVHCRFHQDTSDRSSILYSSSPRTRRPRHAESTSRSSLTLRRGRTALRSASTRHIRA